MFFWRESVDSFEGEAVGVKSAAGVAELRRGPILRQTVKASGEYTLLQPKVIYSAVP